MRRVLLAAVLAACRSHGDEGPAAPPADKVVAEMAPADSVRAKAATPTRSPEPALTLDKPCPSPLVIECDRVVPAELRDTHLANKPLSKTERGECSAGKEGFGITIGVAAGTADSVAQLQQQPDRIAGLGRVAANTVRDQIVFLASNVDCVITIEVPGKLGKGTAFARALDQVFTAQSVAAP